MGKSQNNNGKISFIKEAIDQKIRQAYEPDERQKVWADIKSYQKRYDALVQTQSRKLTQELVDSLLADGDPLIPMGLADNPSLDRELANAVFAWSMKNKDIYLMENLFEKFVVHNNEDWAKSLWDFYRSLERTDTDKIIMARVLLGLKGISTEELLEIGQDNESESGFYSLHGRLLAYDNMDEDTGKEMLRGLKRARQIEVADDAMYYLGPVTAKGAGLATNKIWLIKFLLDANDERGEDKLDKYLLGELMKPLSQEQQSLLLSDFTKQEPELVMSWIEGTGIKTGWSKALLAGLLSKGGKECRVKTTQIMGGAVR